MTRAIRKDWGLSQLVLTAGRRAYLVGAQDGGFPALGGHVPGEMTGLWAHPVKLADGFWLRLDGAWLPPAAAVTVAPAWVAHEYELGGGLRLVRRQWVAPDRPALLLALELSGPPGEHVLELVVRADLRPVWLGEREGLSAVPSRARLLPVGVLVEGEGTSWALAVLPGPAPAVGEVVAASACDPGPEPVAGETGAWVALRWCVELAGGGVRLHAALAGGAEGGEAAVAAAEAALADPPAALRRAEARHAALLARSLAVLPDRDLAEACAWAKVNLEWLARTVPGLGTGIGAGVPEYPWFFGCDTAYAVPALLAAGQFELAKGSLCLLAALSARTGEGGRIIHEATTLGTVYHPGNAQESPQYVWAVAQAVRWSGDRALAAELLPACRAAMAWLDRQPTLAGMPMGYGIIEEPGLDLACLDVAAWAAAGWQGLAELERLRGNAAAAAVAAARAAALAADLHAAFWLPAEGLYADLLATPRQLIPRLQRWLAEAARQGQRHTVAPLQALLARAGRLSPDDPVPWLLGHWTVLTPLELGLAPADAASQSLERLASPEFQAPHGMYLSSLRRTEAMSINTGALAVAACRYGRADLALRLAGKVAATLRRHMPGALPEMLPDYGCFVQAWSAHALLPPVVEHLFGLQPDAPARHLRWRPIAPAGWHGELRAVRLGGARCDVALTPAGPQLTLDEPGWTVTYRGPDGREERAALSPGEPFRPR